MIATAPYVTFSTTVVGSGPWVIVFSGFDLVRPIEEDFPRLDAKKLLSSGDFLTWLFWTRWQFEVPRYRPLHFCRQFIGRRTEVSRPRARARRHAPNHSPRRYCYAT